MGEILECRVVELADTRKIFKAVQAQNRGMVEMEGGWGSPGVCEKVNVVIYSKLECSDQRCFLPNSGFLLLKKASSPSLKSGVRLASAIVWDSFSIWS